MSRAECIRWGVVLTAVAALGVVAARLGLPSDAAQAVAGRGDAGTSAPPDVVASTDGHGGHHDASPDTIVRPVPFSPEPADSLEDVPVVPAESEGTRVRVVDGSTGAPVAGADVYWVPPEHDASGTDAFRPELLDGPPSPGTRHYRTDGSGMTTVPWSSERVSLFARLGDLGAVGLSWARDGEVVTMTLESVIRLRILAEDSTGAPVRWADLTMDSPAPWDARHHSVATTMPPDGIATFVDLAPLLAVSGALAAVSRPSVRGDSWTIGTVLGGPIVNGSAVDPRQLATHVHSVRLGPVGAIEGRLVTRDGTPIPGPAFVSAARVDPARASTGVIYRRAPQCGAFRIGAVPLNSVLSITARLPGRYEQATTIVGPTSGGEVVAAAIVVGDEFLRIRGKLVDDHGHAIAQDARVVATLEASDGARLPELETQMKPDGVFEIEVPFRLRIRPAVLRFAIAQKGPAPPWSGQVGFPDPAPLHVVDVRTVVLEVPDLIASGVVVDQEGRHVPGVRVVLQAAAPSTDPGDDSGEEDFKWTDLSWTTGADGTFFAFGKPPEGHLAFGCAGGGFIQVTSTPFTRGDRGVRLVVDATSTIGGRIELPPGVASSDVTVTATYGGASVTDRAAIIPLRLAADGTFRRENLAPTSVHLQLTVRGAHSNLSRELGTFPLAVDAVIEPPELNPLVLAEPAPGGADRTR